MGGTAAAARGNGDAEAVAKAVAAESLTAALVANDHFADPLLRSSPAQVRALLSGLWCRLLDTTTLDAHALALDFGRRFAASGALDATGPYGSAGHSAWTTWIARWADVYDDVLSVEPMPFGQLTA